MFLLVRQSPEVVCYHRIPVVKPKVGAPVAVEWGVEAVLELGL